jgi:very-short-patch-repair endonuclease
MSIVRIEVSLLDKINLALHQNAVPVLRALAVANPGAAPLADLVLTLQAEPAFLRPKRWHIDRIGAQEQLALPELDLALDAPLLARLTEAETAHLRFELRPRVAAAAVAGESAATPLAAPALARLDCAVELLPRQHWGGLGQMPEMVAAFVQPNDPAIARLLKDAAEVLRRHGKATALDGYRSGARHAWEQTAALWHALAARGLDYALPPASFELQGQKVRTPTQVLDSGLATCLDLSLLLCAALEQCGLHALLVFQQGHALAGVWLQPNSLPDAVTTDPTALRKRQMLRELVLFETTLLTQRPAPGFSQAAELGTQRLLEAQDTRFECVIDLARARLQRIRPLASLDAAPPAGAAGEDTAPLSIFDEAPTLPAPETPADSPPAAPDDRLARWQRKLLDLSLRNNLLNFRAGKKAIRFEAPEPGRIEDLLASGQALKLLARPELGSGSGLGGNDARQPELYQAREHEDLRRVHALDALARKELHVALPADELEARLVELYRSARSTEQETGSNTLFLAFGFLGWKKGHGSTGKEAADDKRHLAPLILVPVTLRRQSVRSGFTLVLHDDEPRFNPTLLEMLRQDFHLQLPIPDELPRDEHGLDVAAVWRSVSAAVKDIAGWEVVQDVVLAPFSFAKFLMWKDLAERAEQLKASRVVRHLLETPRDPYPNDVPFPEPRRLDLECPPEQVFCPLPADSSQLAAVVAASRGKDFVLIGPPGTGKSQTIANMIAHSLAEGRRVLFVSEKIAALDVVYRRLREVGLGEFCLELHSSKARKLDVLNQLRRTWEARGTVDEASWRREAARLGQLRAQLNAYVERLHLPHRNGWTLYQAIGRVALAPQHTSLGLAWPDADTHDSADLQRLRELVDRLGVNAQAVAAQWSDPSSAAAWHWLAQPDWAPGWQQQLLAAAQALGEQATALQQAAVAFGEALGWPLGAELGAEPATVPGTLPGTTGSPTADPRQSLPRPLRQALGQLAQLLSAASGHDWRFALRPDAAALGARLRDALGLLRQHQALQSQLGTPWPDELQQRLAHGLKLLERHHELSRQLSYGPTAAQLNLIQLQADWQRATQSFWPLGWLRQRPVRATLQAAAGSRVIGDVTTELQHLTQLHQIDADLVRLHDLTSATFEIWQGHATDIPAARAALACQVALAQARCGQPWRDSELGPVAEGRCGVHLADDLARMQALRELAQRIETCACLAGPTGGLWQGLHSDTATVEQALHFSLALPGLLAQLAGRPEALAELHTAIEWLLGSGNSLLAPQGALTRAAQELLARLGTLTGALDPFAQLAGLDKAGHHALADLDLPSLVALARSLLAAPGRLRAWCAWQKARGQADTAGLTPLLTALEHGRLTPQQLREAFETDYARWWLGAAVDADPLMRGFVVAEHEQAIRDFQALDTRHTELTRAWVRARLCGELPSQDSVGRSSEWGLLKREMQKKRAHLPLRELMGQAPAAIAQLAPCLLMSPLSIAQYLPAGSAGFDLVVFDEASQIPVWDAIGAIARGRQVVMVGDPKQLPPTSFFDRAEADDDDAADAVEAELESILDECLGANLPTLNLSWHYRSRSESLIAFSNHRYYGGQLVTFPSPQTHDSAVSWRHVPDGVYDKGGARTNIIEARALVAELVARLLAPGFAESGRTVGIVTFNAEQQRLIEDLLDAERRREPALERHFAEGLLEPLFVKNLESVQGDERDIMYFSLTYGPDRAGVVSMNFGPMNRNGGERRLNVAITRARQELRVFSSLRPESIDLSRTQAAGVRDLKLFMDYAERGAIALAQQDGGSLGGFESPFEQAVAEALGRLGWQLHSQVGVSAFRIDLAVVDPDAPGRYLAGIECDGATYHRSATARDRDKLREQVLRGLCWQIVRIWSTDWWIDASGCAERVHARLQQLLAASRAERAAVTPAPAPVAP